MGGGGYPLGVPAGVPTIISSSTRSAMLGYNRPTNLLEIQMKDVLAAVVIGLALCAALLHGLDALFY